MICHHIGIFSLHAEELIRFYKENLGFTEGKSRTISSELMGQIFGTAVEFRLRKLKMGQVTLEIFSPQSRMNVHKSSTCTGYNHWGLKVQDKDSYVQSLEQKGVSLMRFTSGPRMIYFLKDPDGNLIEIYEK